MVWLPDGEKNSNICLFVLTWSTNVKKSPFSRTAAHIFVSPGDAPTTITQYVAWMERQFNACQTPRSMYYLSSIVSELPMLKSMRKSKNRYFYHIFVFPGDAPGAITLNVVWIEKEFDAYKLSCCMAACAHLSITVSEIERDICEKIVIFGRPLGQAYAIGNPSVRPSVTLVDCGQTA